MRFLFYNNKRRRKINVKLFLLFAVTFFILYTTHNLLDFTNISSEITFDLFIFSGFVALLGVMLLSEQTPQFVINNPAEVPLTGKVFAKNKPNLDLEESQVELLDGKNRKTLSGTQQVLQEQLLAILDGQIDQSAIIGFVSNFYWLELNQNDIEQVKAYVRDEATNFDLMVMKSTNYSNIPQVKASNRELHVSQKGLYKKVYIIDYRYNKVEKAQYFVLHKTYKIYQNAAGQIVKADEKIAIKLITGFAFKLPFQRTNRHS